MVEHMVILASGSPRRKELLEQVGIRPLVIKSRIEEKITESDPAKVVEELSLQKASDVAEHLTEYMIDLSEDENPLLAPTEENVGQVPVFDPTTAAVIGADTVVAVDGKILGKPKTHAKAREMIRELEGRTHQVFTGVTIVKQGSKTTFHEETRVHVLPMTEEEIRAYADSEEPMDKAGAYGIQGTFGRYIDRIEGDYYNVVGLPIARVYHNL